MVSSAALRTEGIAILPCCVGKRDNVLALSAEYVETRSLSAMEARWRNPDEFFALFVMEWFDSE